MGLNQHYNSSEAIYIMFLILTILSNLATTEGGFGGPLALPVVFFFLH